MRILGIDFGFKRIGIAVGDPTLELTTPLPSLTAAGSLKQDAKNVKLICDKEKVTKVVLGIPYSIHGTINKQANVCLQFAERLKEQDLTVYTIDESLTSVEVEDELRSFGLKAAARRKRSDSEAARRILERFFREHEPEN